ncbi:GT99 family glycosyltransferase N-terminal domain-containing protein [Blautia sp. HCP3S3_H10_1]|uniref:GT99 family glycosyltransferase N-terminal domain-containing protein n=1 Tax=unclassified Blautia TaxID=2648079 RepID=UPI003F93A278
MIIPVVFSLDPVNNLPCLWSFYKGVSFAKRFAWPVISQERYFECFGRHPKGFEFFEEDAVCAKFEYDKPEVEDLNKITQVKFPEKIEREYIRGFASQTDAYMTCLIKSWPEMEAFLRNAIKIIEAQYTEKIEAFIVFQSYKFIDNVADEVKIPVFHYEWGPMRYDFYRNTSYFDRKGIYGDSDFQQRLEKFNEEWDDSLPIFSKRELLALLLEKEYLHYATDMYPNPKYEVGLAFGYSNATAVTARNRISAVELYSKVQRIFSEDEIGVRYHPGDPLHANLRKGQESSGKLIDFILNCKRIACACSNVAFEAMLFGRIVYEEKWSQYGCIANNLDEGLTERMPDDHIMNFVVFNLLIPFELLNNVEYIRFRLKEKSEKRIFLYHLNYYLSTLNISKRILKLDSDARLKVIIAIREGKMEAKEIDVKEYVDFNIEEGFGAEVTNQIKEERTKNLIKEKESYINSLVSKCQEEYEELVKTNELLKKEQEYSKSLLEGIKFRDDRINELDSLLSKEQAYSKSLIDGIIFRDSEIKRITEDAGNVHEMMEYLGEKMKSVESEVKGCKSSIESEIEAKKNRWKIFGKKK